MDNHRCKRRAHSEDQFSAPKTIYFTLLSSLAAFPEICQQLLSAKDTHLASKSNDKGPSSLPMEVMFDSENKSIYSQQKKRPNWINLIGKFLKTATDFLYIMCNFSEKKKKTIPALLCLCGWGQEEMDFFFKKKKNAITENVG